MAEEHPVVLIDHGHGIHALDAQFLRPRLAAIHLLVQDDEVAIVDTAHNLATPRVLTALSQLGLQPVHVRYILLTHIHLDHAGGAGTLMAQCPRATLVVHPRGVRHMVDPSRLMAATAAVYGEDEARRRYGVLQPVAEERILRASEGLTLDLAGRALEVMDTPGHAAHHVSFLDHESRSAFPGDTFGLSYREVDQDGQQFVFPTTSPSQFDPAALHHSINRLCAWQPQALYITHFSRLHNIAPLAARLHELIDQSVAIAQRHRHRPLNERKGLIHADIRQLVHEEGSRQGYGLAGNALDQVFNEDYELNTQGLLSWLEQQGAQ